MNHQNEKQSPYERGYRPLKSEQEQQTVQEALEDTHEPGAVTSDQVQNNQDTQIAQGKQGENNEHVLQDDQGLQAIPSKRNKKTTDEDIEASIEFCE